MSYQRGIEGGDFCPGMEYPPSSGWLVDPNMESLARELDLGRGCDWGMMFGGGPFFAPGADIDMLRGVEAWQPECNMRETDEGMFIEASLPGVKREDIELRLIDGDLVLGGECKEEKSREGEGYWSKERLRGKFRRRISLPPGVQVSQIRTGFQNGLLQVLVPLPALEGSRRRSQIGEGGFGQEQLGSRSPTVPCREEGGPIQEAGTREETKPLLEKEKGKEREQPRSVFIGRESATTGPANV